MKGRLGLLAGIMGLAIFSNGCAEEQLPPEPFPGASRLRMENPAAYANKIKGLEEEKKASTKVNAKQQRAEAIRQKAEMSDPRAAARAKLQQEQGAEPK